jgi:hypothetical protein
MFSRLINGCAWNDAVSAFANCGRAVAHVRGSHSIARPYLFGQETIFFRIDKA